MCAAKAFDNNSGPSSDAQAASADSEESLRKHVVSFLSERKPGSDRAAIKVIQEISGIRLTPVGLELF